MSNTKDFTKIENLEQKDLFILDDMDELEEMSGDSVNFIPCLKFVSRGVAKPTPDKVSPIFKYFHQRYLKCL